MQGLFMHRMKTTGPDEDGWFKFEPNTCEEENRLDFHPDGMKCRVCGKLLKANYPIIEGRVIREENDTRPAQTGTSCARLQNKDISGA